MALALYRKYRPSTFADMIGQAELVSVLLNAAQRNKIAHAYLFYGPRGTGKTTAARILAKIVNCETRVADAKFHAQGEPCNTCRRCLTIDRGTALDVTEIDAASNRGIDEIRALKESVHLAPSSFPYKVFIIDEAHQLTKEAWNALLKTLEEPPAHAIFIFATTEYEKVPATIISRTQRFHFKKPPLPEILKKLSHIVAEENLKISDDAIELIAASAEGSFRDAESLLDQLTALSEKVTLEIVESIVGKVGFSRIAKLADAILERDLSGALADVRTIESGGGNVAEAAKELIHYFRRLLTIAADSRMLEIFKQELTDNEVKKIQEQSKRIRFDAHIPFLRALIASWSDMRYSPFAAIPLEVTIIEHLKS